LLYGIRGAWRGARQAACLLRRHSGIGVRSEEMGRCAPNPKPTRISRKDAKGAKGASDETTARSSPRSFDAFGTDVSSPEGLRTSRRTEPRQDLKRVGPSDSLSPIRQWNHPQSSLFGNAEVPLPIQSLVEDGEKRSRQKRRRFGNRPRTTTTSGSRCIPPLYVAGTPPNLRRIYQYGSLLLHPVP